MTRTHHQLLLSCTFAAALANAQQPAAADPLTAATQALQKATVTWQTLARDLDQRVARLLPCDPKAKASIDEVSRTSQARLAALDQYYQLAVANATLRSDGAKRLLTREESRAADIADERAQAEQSVTATQDQLTALAANAQKVEGLAPSQAALRQAAEAARQRTTIAKEQADRHEPAVAALREFSAAAQAYEAAIKEERASFEAERTRWNGYYAARLARLQTECAITSGVSAPPVSTPKPPAPAKAKPRAKGKAK